MVDAQHNPYAAPKARLEVAFDDTQGLWRDGKILVCLRDAEFPARCVKCNDPAGPPPARYKLAWHNPLWYLLIFVYILIYIIAALIVRKRAQIHVGLCDKHKRRRVLGRSIGWGGLAAIIVMIGIGAGYGIPTLALIGGACILPWAFAAVLLTPQLQAAWIDKEMLRIRGCGRDFLDTLPEHPG